MTWWRWVRSVSCAGCSSKGPIASGNNLVRRPGACTHRLVSCAGCWSRRRPFSSLLKTATCGWARPPVERKGEPGCRRGDCSTSPPAVAPETNREARRRKSSPPFRVTVLQRDREAVKAPSKTVEMNATRMTYVVISLQSSRVEVNLQGTAEFSHQPTHLNHHNSKLQKQEGITQDKVTLSDTGNSATTLIQLAEDT